MSRQLGTGVYVGLWLSSVVTRRLHSLFAIHRTTMWTVCTVFLKSLLHVYTLGDEITSASYHFSTLKQRAMRFLKALKESKPKRQAAILNFVQRHISSENHFVWLPNLAKMFWTTVDLLQVEDFQLRFWPWTLTLTPKKLIWAQILNIRAKFHDSQTSTVGQITSDAMLTNRTNERTN